MHYKIKKMEKPNIFIGSSVEGLDIAYAIQENLEYISETTIWDQGIFELTSTALDDLLNTLKKTDIGIFIFSPDDIIKIRNNSFKTTRDNVIFELGLFLGYLGKNRVSFVMPRDIKDFHLPTDLTGITPGYYNPKRKDNNLRASLGPYCNQIKNLLEKSSIIKLSSFQNDSEIIKRIVIFKPENWEFLLTKEILKVEMEKLNRTIHEVKYDLYISKSVTCSVSEFLEILTERNDIFNQLLIAFRNNFKLLTKSWGEPGEVGDEEQIKETTLRMVSYGFKALEIEKEIKGLLFPEQVSEFKNYLFNWYIPITDAIKSFYDKLEFYFHDNNPPDEVLDFNLKMDTPENVLKMTNKIAELKEIIH